MPGRDRTGPLGMGPMTGRGFGDCAGYPGIGFGGRAFSAWGGHGWRHWFRATGLPGWVRAGYVPAWGAGYWQQPTSEEEATLLRSQANLLRNALEQIEARLQELEEEQGE